MGGGESAAPEDHSLEVEYARQEADKQARAQQLQDQETADNKAETMFQQQLNAGHDDALSQVLAKLTGAGLDTTNTSQYYNAAKGAVDNRAQATPDKYADPLSFINPDQIAQTIMSPVKASTIKGYTGALSNAFGDNYADSVFSPNTGSDVISNLLAQQGGLTKTSLDNAHSRGTLDDTGYNAALQEYNNEQTAARGRFKTIGDSVVSGYKDDLNQQVGNAMTKASGWDFGQNFDPNQYINSIKTKASGYQSSVNDDITNALMGQNAFDTNKILGAGGIAQGAINPATNGSGAVLGTGAPNPTDVVAPNNKRGLGTQGAF